MKAKSLKEILFFIKTNYPAGCTAAEITNRLYRGENEATTAKHRNSAYTDLRRMVEAGQIEKTWSGYYRPKISRNRRYYLHRRIKKYFKVDARKKQVDYIAEHTTPELIRTQLKELASAGYNIQTTIQ